MFDFAGSTLRKGSARLRLGLTLLGILAFRILDQDKNLQEQVNGKGPASGGGTVAGAPTRAG